MSHCTTTAYTHLRRRVGTLRRDSPDAAQTKAHLDAAFVFVKRWQALVEQQAFDCWFIVNGMWNELVPAEWQPFLAGASDVELAGLVQGVAPNSWPASLHQFVKEAQQMQLDPTPTKDATTLPPNGRRHWRGTSAKKRIEIERMAGCISASSKSLGVPAVMYVAPVCACDREREREREERGGVNDADNGCDVLFMPACLPACLPRRTIT
jgi:hypothetical protein